ncbi:hypothetical protein [Serratia fonticola]|uniref:hypothetical protein n=1 Tax=Serratia fonticola TaxID=47917 RepID=UPI003AAC8793
MIGRMNPPPSFSNGCINHNNDTHLEKKTLINQITGSVINVKNTNADFRIVGKELFLYREVKDNTMLATVADTKFHNSQNTRFSSLGMAVTAISNPGEDENEKAKEKSVEFNCDFVLTKRGQEYINQFLDAKTPLDATNYAIGLRVGSDMKNKVSDSIMVDQFNSTWNMRLNGFVALTERSQ